MKSRVARDRNTDTDIDMDIHEPAQLLLATLKNQTAGKSAGWGPNPARTGRQLPSHVWNARANHGGFGKSAGIKHLTIRGSLRDRRHWVSGFSRSQAPLIPRQRIVATRNTSVASRLHYI